jgi:hypothetical protein
MNRYKKLVDAALMEAFGFGYKSAQEGLTPQEGWEKYYVRVSKENNPKSAPESSEQAR